MSGIDWGGLMRRAIMQRGLLPVEFWALTPAEVLLVLGIDTDGSAPMARGRLEALAKIWPDENGEEHG